MVELKSSNQQHDNSQEEEKITELNQIIQERDTEMRKQLHNHIQILKGNIRVYCRVKPLLASRLSQNFSSMDQVKSSIEFPQRLRDELQTQLEVNGTDQQSKLFHFDCVFPHESTQTQIFNEVKPFIQTALDGENVCIFAYGQTGSGKTYTMEGPDYGYMQDDNCYQINDCSGIIPRAANFIFSEIDRIKAQFKREYHIEISSMEIYCENLRDLYNDQVDQQLNLVSVKNKILIQGQSWKKVENINDFLKLVQISSAKRVTSSNGVNEHSSRSHHIFQIKILGQNKSFESVESLLNIIDLAGSERRSNISAAAPTTNGTAQQSLDRKPTISKPKVADKNFHQSKTINKKPVNKGKQDLNDSFKAEQQQQILEQESVSINKSLTTLGRVFMMIADRKCKSKQNPPYRESKLTRILQDCLTSETKTLMIVNICSGNENIQQTKESLNFASQAMLAY
ncbi:carboxy-terminal kinesin 2 [Stylonychia lemnae]|uniref:Carboxy-terminal kinesin 2 n=1 Tax=Stylonychia lemnae TaxID=5949 RepID=A0A078A0L5_STYLE|nr:carboxy-terminal kinesin 2 [Stylonychia lemnae]|eukprot:CDW75746.1 carboxy-terminal kinesin 2 [Stylonychia lemnae]